MSLQQIVSTTLAVSGGPAFVSTFNSVASAADRASASVANTVRSAIPLQSILAAGLGALSVNKIIDIGSSFEMTQNKMAGFFAALGQAPNFNAGLELADVTMRQIEITAARLPGEAEEYVKVFTQGLPQIQKAVGGSMNDMLKFSNTITAIGRTFNIDAVQISHDLQRMLQVGKGGAGLDVRTFTEMLPFLQQVDGQQKLNTESFNKMTNVQRAHLLQEAFKPLQPMIDHAATSWDAMRGAVVSTVSMLTRLSTAPIFDGLKQGMGAVSAAFFDTNGQATALADNVIAVGRVVSTYLVTGVQQVIQGVSWIAENGAGLLESIFSFRLGGFEQMMQSFALDTNNPQVVGILDSIGASADNMIEIFSSLTAAIVPIWDTFQLLHGAVEGVAAIVLPMFTDAILTVVQPLSMMFHSVYSVVQEIITDMIPHIAVFANGIGTLVMGIADFLSPAIHLVGIAFTSIVTLAKDYLMPAINFVIWGLGKLATGIGWVLSTIGKSLDKAMGFEKQPARERTANAVSSWLSDLSASIEAEKRKRASAREAEAGTAQMMNRKAPVSRSGTTVTQDFRYSKFTIDQKFEQGHDPDRIAVLFAKEISNAGSQKLQSGFEPLFALRG